MATPSTFHLANYQIEGQNCEPIFRNDAIQQGRDYEVIILYPGDVSTGIPVAEIRDNTVQQGGTVLATFSYDTLSYDAVNNKTTIILRLTNSDTDSIPETPLITSNRLQSADKYNQWDAYLQFNGKNLRMIEQGFVQVLGKTTA